MSKTSVFNKMFIFSKRLNKNASKKNKKSMYFVSQRKINGSHTSIYKIFCWGV